MNIELPSLMLMAFALGLLHALDADHIMAVTGLSCQQTSRIQSIVYSTRWSLGHAGALLVIGVAVLFLGMAIPKDMSVYAEFGVGVVLIIIGALVIKDVMQQRAHIHFHRHDGLPDHAHWHSHKHSTSKHESDMHRHTHAPLFVGALHGTAGSAPLLVLLPLSQFSSPWLGLAYLLLFGIGVFTAMLVFGGVLGRVLVMIKTRGTSMVNVIRLLVAMMSMTYGVHMTMVVVS